MTELRILSADDVRAALDMTAAIAAVRAAFVELSTGAAQVPLRLSLDAGACTTLVMPAFLPASRDLATKVVSVAPENARRGLPVVSGAVLVLDASTGVPRALLDGSSLTALRTGAASGVATDLLASPDARVLAVFGAGVQARTQIAAVRAVRRIEEVRVVARTRASAEKLAGELEGVAARALEDRREAVRGADVVVAATDSSVPVFPGAAVEPGAHVNGVGSYTPQMREVDGDLIARAVVVVDSRSAALAEAGDLIQAIREGRVGEGHIRAELGEVAAGLRPGRTSSGEVTFFKSVGSAAQDAAAAGATLRSAEARGLGTLARI